MMDQKREDSLDGADNPWRSTDLELIRRAETFGQATAIVSGGVRYGYLELLEASARAASALLQGADDLREQRVGLFVPAGFEHVACQWGAWRAGGVVVPIDVSAAEPEIEHRLADAAVAAVMTPERLVDRIRPACQRLGIRLALVEPALAAVATPLPRLKPSRRAMIVYTSGTTSKPKGVVTCHANLEAQIRCLVQAWGWRADDRIPLMLPLDHVHGIVNVLSCGLWSGALVEPFERFELETLLARVVDGAYTLFMAVPTIYARLIEALETMPPELRRQHTRGLSRMRLQVSGSAALPARFHQRWELLTGQRLLERYGMTEIGMALSNPLVGERRPGAVGRPLPGVEVRLLAEDGSLVAGENEPGEIQVRGPGVFLEYWGQPEATEAAFLDGWFRTGDVAVLEDGYYRILGRLSVDIINSGGYKLSALEIEDILAQHPGVRECAVVGVPDSTWGEAVAAAVVTEQGAELDLADLQAWAVDKMSSYKLPRRLAIVHELPRNSLGKVTKPAIKKLFGTDRDRLHPPVS